MVFERAPVNPKVIHVISPAVVSNPMSRVNHQPSRHWVQFYSLFRFYSQERLIYCNLVIWRANLWLSHSFEEALLCGVMLRDLRYHPNPTLTGSSHDYSNMFACMQNTQQRDLETHRPTARPFRSQRIHFDDMSSDMYDKRSRHIS